MENAYYYRQEQQQRLVWAPHGTHSPQARFGLLGKAALVTERLSRFQSAFKRKRPASEASEAVLWSGRRHLGLHLFLVLSSSGFPKTSEILLTSLGLRHY